MTSSTNSQILIENKGHTGVITLNRPEVYNALNKENKWSIIRAINQFESDSSISAIVLTGSGKAFSTGQDLNDRNTESSGTQTQSPSLTSNLGDTLETQWNPLVKAIRSSKKPVIAAINGVCAGAGISVALSCDLVTSAKNVKFVGGFGKLALCLDAGSTYLLVKALGEKKVFEFYASNAPLLSEQLYDAGLINHLCDEPFQKALELAEMTHKCDPKALEVVKFNIQSASESSYHNVIADETHGQRLLGTRESYHEGIKAFFEKRAPKFRK